MIQFRSIGSGGNITLSEFDATVTIDKSDYPIHVHVVSDEARVAHRCKFSKNCSDYDECWRNCY